MNRHFVVALLLPCIIYARVLPVYDPDARIDDKKTGVVNNQQFLNAFLGNVDSSDSKVKPITDEINGPSDFGSGSTKGNDKPRKEEDGYDDYDDGYGNDIYDDDFYESSDGYPDQYELQHTDDYDSDKGAHYYKASINCREFHYPHATTPKQCRDVKVRDYEPDYNRNDPNEKAFCRWDMGFSDDKDKHEGCLCPRTKYKCHKKLQCYWYKPKHSAHGNDDDDHGQCLHNSERFYNILANLLSKRGKKDFALKIKYSSAAAKGHLPYGPWGPGYFPYDQQLYKHSPIGKMDYGHQNEYDFSYDTPHGYGHQGGYGYDNHIGGYGAHHHRGNGAHSHIGGYAAHNHGDYMVNSQIGGYGADNQDVGYGVSNHMGGYGALNHIGGYGADSHVGGYGADSHVGGYGADSHVGGYGADNHIGGYGDYPNSVGGYGSNQPVSNDQYSTGYNVNQGFDTYGAAYGYEGYGNSQPMYNAYHSGNPTHSAVTPIDANVPYAHAQSNYIENTAYPPAREAHTLQSQNVRPLPAPEFQALPPPSEPPIYGSFPPGVSSAPYQDVPNRNGPFGHVNMNYGKVPPQAHGLPSIPVKPVDSAQYQAAAPPVNVPVHQHPHPTQPYFR